MYRHFFPLFSWGKGKRTTLFLFSFFSPSPEEMDTVCVTFLNTKGLNVPKKRKMLLNDLKQTRTDVVFVQETHFKVGGLHFLVYTMPPIRRKNLKVFLFWSLVMYPGLSLIGALIQMASIFFLKVILKVTLATIFAPILHQYFFF